MDPTQKQEAKREAWARLAARRRRTGLLRGRVIALTAICFVALWAIVFAQMAAGDDPALSGKEKTTATTSVESEAASKETYEEVEEDEESFAAGEAEAEASTEYETTEETEPMMTGQS